MEKMSQTSFEAKQTTVVITTDLPLLIEHIRCHQIKKDNITFFDSLLFILHRDQYTPIALNMLHFTEGSHT